MLEFAVHDLGSMGIGALLIYRPDGEPGPPVEERLPTPPPLRIRTPATSPRSVTRSPRSTAPPSSTPTVCCASSVCGWCRATRPRNVEALGGTRHTSGRRYSYDDPPATVIAVSEDGPVSVLRNGDVLAQLPP